MKSYVIGLDPKSDTHLIISNILAVLVFLVFRPLATGISNICKNNDSITRSRKVHMLF